MPCRAVSCEPQEHEDAVHLLSLGLRYETRPQTHRHRRYRRYAAGTATAATAVTAVRTTNPRSQQNQQLISLHCEIKEAGWRSRGEKGVGRDLIR